MALAQIEMKADEHTRMKRGASIHGRAIFKVCSAGPGDWPCDKGKEEEGEDEIHGAFLEYPVVGTVLDRRYPYPKINHEVQC